MAAVIFYSRHQQYYQSPGGERHSKSTSPPLFGYFIKTDASHVMKAIWHGLSLCSVLGGSYRCWGWRWKQRRAGAAAGAVVWHVSSARSSPVTAPPVYDKWWGAEWANREVMPVGSLVGQVTAGWEADTLCSMLLCSASDGQIHLFPTYAQTT